MISQLTDIHKIKFIVNDLEQKIFFLVIPFITIILFIDQPLIAIWIGNNIEIISISISVIVASFLIFSSTINPFYQFLIAKGQASKTITLQGVNVVTNIFLFMLTYRWIGYYAVIVGNSGAILTSFILALYFHRNIFNSLIFDNYIQLVKFIAIILINLITGIIVISLIYTNLMKLLLIPIFLFISTILAYRMFYVFTPADIDRYLGENNFLSGLCLMILCKGSNGKLSAT